MKKGFTLIELIFVIVVLGILASIAIPRFGSTANDANIAKGRSDVSSIRAGIINERQGRLLRGEVSYAATLDSAATTAGESLFGTVLTTPIISADQDGHWMKSATGYIFKVDNTAVNFTYTSADGNFTCDRTASGNEGTYCKRLVD